MKLKEVRLFKKASSNAGLPVSDFASLALLGNMAKALGSFDYIDVQTDVNNPNRVAVNYLDYDRVEDEGKKTLYYGSIVFNNNKYTVDKVPLSKIRGGTTRVYPAKPGYVMVLTYNKKEKKIDLDLVKLKA